MTSTQTLMKILEIVNSKGGVSFIYIKMFLEQLDEDAEQGSALAIRLKQDLTNIMRVLEKVVKIQE